MVKSMFAGLKMPVSSRLPGFIPGLGLRLAAPFHRTAAALKLTCPFQIVRSSDTVAANG